MKKTLLLSLVAFASITAKSQCLVSTIPVADCSFGDQIQSFNLNGIAAVDAGCSAGGYQMFAAPVFTLTAGNTYTWNATCGPTWSQGFAMWIDYDNNGIFDPTEMVGNTPSSLSHSGSFVLPLTSSIGINRKMRIRCKYATTILNSEACAAFTYGEVEDYNVTIVCPTVAPTITATASSNTICAGSTVTLTGSGAVNYTWTPVGITTATAAVTPTATAIYTLSAVMVGCPTLTSTTTKTITVNATTVTVNSGAICTGSAFTITPAGSATSYTISGGSAVVTPTANATYTVTGTNSVTTCSNSAISTVTVNALPTISVTSGAICAGNSYTMVASGAGTYTYTGGSAVVTPTANTSYSVTGTSTLGCVGSNTAVSSVTVNANPSVSASTSNSMICSGESAVLTASTSATSYTWNTGATTMSVSVSPTVTSTYTVNVSNAAACVASSTVMVTVNACVGINEAVANLISVYPNPNNGVVNINLTAELAKNATLEVYDALGKLVVKQVLVNELNTINMSNLDNGIYTFKVLNNTNTVKIGKLIKQ